MEPSQTPHINLIGAGPVGLATAAWLLRETPWRVTLIDAKTPEAAQHDPRALALSWGSRQLLEGLSAWPQAATPIAHIHVSQRGYMGRTVLHHDAFKIPALGYVVRYGDVVTSLAQALRMLASPRLTWLTEHTVTHADASSGAVQVRTKEGAEHTLQADVIVSAEGGFFHTQAHKGRQRDYGQTGLISIVTCTQPQVGWAWERFTDEGPLALLPHALPPSPSTASHPVPNTPAWALVWCGTPEHTAARMAMDDASFLQALGKAFGGRMGQFTWADKRAAFPLGLNATDTLVQDRMVAIGNAAQTLHPVAGQGLNLGLRDAYALVQALRDEVSPAALNAFSAARQADRKATIGITDTLARGFTASFDAEYGRYLPAGEMLLGHLRGAALMAVDVVPPLKNFLAKQMMFGRR